MYDEEQIKRRSARLHAIWSVRIASAGVTVLVVPKGRCWDGVSRARYPSGPYGEAVDVWLCLATAARHARRVGLARARELFENRFHDWWRWYGAFCEVNRNNGRPLLSEHLRYRYA
jgi:hypothetical protein